MMRFGLPELGYQMTLRAERQERMCPDAALGMDWQGQSGKPCKGSSLPCSGAEICPRRREHRK